MVYGWCVWLLDLISTLMGVIVLDGLVYEDQSEM
jgi:hypothetical protein